MIKTIIFDYDGVIVDSFICIFEVYKVICKELGKKCPDTFEGFRKVYGKSQFECFHNLKFDPKDSEKIEIIFKREILKQKPEMFKGIPETLQKLKERYKLILLTATYRDEAVQKLEKFDLMKYFSQVIGVQHPTDPPLKKSEKVKQLLKEQSLAAEEVVMIGDRDIDYEAAKMAGITNIILVEYGWGYHKETLPHQKVTVNKPLDLLEAVKAITS